MFPLAPDDTPYRLVTTDGVSTFDTPAGTFLKVEPEAITALTAGGDARHRPLPPARSPGPTAQGPRRPGGERQRPLRRPRPAEERRRLGRRRAADVPGHGHGDRQGEEGPVRVHRRRRRGGDRRGRATHLRDDQPALQPDGPADDVRGAQHRHQPAGRDQDLRRRRRHVLVPLHRQGRWQRQQVVPLPRDQGAAQRGDAAAVDLREDADAGHRRLPAVSPRRRRRRHVGGVGRRDRQAGVDALPRHAADRRARRRATPSATSSWRPRCCELAQQTGIGAQFGGKYFCHDVRIVRLPRHGASCPVAMAVSCSADRQAKGKITRRRRVPRTAGDRPGALPARGHRSARRARRRCTSTSTARCRRSSPSCHGIP